METQLFLTYLIIAAAVSYTIYNLALLFKPKESGCGSSCGGCDFKNELRKRGIHPNLNIKDENFTYIKK